MAKKKQPKKAVDLMVETPPIKFPWHVMRFFGEGSRQIDFANDQASFGEDYGNIYEIREALDWLTDQFGGKVNWK